MLLIHVQNEHCLFSEPEKMKSMSQLAILTRRWNPAMMKLGPFQEVILESSRVDELKEKVLMFFHNLLIKYEKDSSRHDLKRTHHA